MSFRNVYNFGSRRYRRSQEQPVRVGRGGRQASGFHVEERFIPVVRRPLTPIASGVASSFSGTPLERSRKLEADNRRRERAIVTAFVESAIAGEIDRIDLHATAVDKAFLWRRAFQAIAKAAEVPQDYRHAFMSVWVRRGDHIRGEVRDDRILFAGLRRLLPAYEGGPMTLYRGDSGYNSRRRSYGPSWSSDEGVARSFAAGTLRVSAGGSVLLKTVAPPDAIICAPTLHDESYGEFEYLVERRKLKKVEVVERFAQISDEDYVALCRANASDTT
jgi:hypothetical protein